jgi:hypothetical protein
MMLCALENGNIVTELEREQPVRQTGLEGFSVTEGVGL